MKMKNFQEHEKMVSVIMPCYNDGPYIGEAIDSLRKQTWTNIELIIIDDGSDDGETVQIIEREPFPTKRVLRTKHIGPAAARNRGIAEAKGDFILPLDADDKIDSTYILKAMNVMLSNSNVGIVYCRADMFGEASGSWDLPEYSLRAELLDNCIFVTALFRRTDWSRVGGFCEEFRVGMEDYDFWLSLLEMGREVYQLPETLFHYRIKPVSRTTKFQQNYVDIQKTYEMLFQRHRELYKKNMDIYCLELRKQLIDHLMQNRQLKEKNNLLSKEQESWESMKSDPLVEYAISIRCLKPRLGAYLTKLLQFKNKAKRILGRK